MRGHTQSSVKKSLFWVLALALLFAFTMVWLTIRSARQAHSNAVLIGAVKCRDASTVIAALKNGADPNAQDVPVAPFSLTHLIMQGLLRQYPHRDYHQTALQIATHEKPVNLEIIKALLDQGANPDVQDRQGWTPLMSTLRYAKEPAALLILNKSRDVRRRNAAGDTALHFACMEQLAVAVQALTRRGADVNAMDENGDTPLLLAVHEAGKNAEVICKDLLQHGGNANAWASNTEETALNIAVTYGRPEVVKLLVENGADVNAKDFDGWSPLIAAAYYGENEDGRILIAAGANLHYETAPGFTARKAAHVQSHRAFEKMLRRH